LVKVERDRERETDMSLRDERQEEVINVEVIF
jgi:hypothetical protein